MPSILFPWTIYREALAPLGYGHPLWNPSPIYSYNRVRLGDVGYICEGRFHLLFSAGIPLGSRVLGTDVPLTFEPLDVRPIIPDNVIQQPHLHPGTVRQIGTDIGGSAAVSLTAEPGARFSFELTGKRGAALITKHPIYRERIERDHEFADYAKKHYASWVNFAREQKHQGDVRPILVTGVSLAPEFATVAYSDNRGPRAGCEFSTALPDIASASASGWGTWSVAGLVHTNCGPDPPEQNPRPSPGYAPGSEIPNECTQCVFIDYYTICKRRRIPTAIEVDLGLHQFPTWDYDLDQEGIFYGVDSTEVYIDYSETGLPRYVVYEVVSDFPADDRNGLDVLAEFILNQRSDAEFVLLRHDDIQDFPQGDKEELIRLLAESRVVERVEVDENGVAELLRPTSFCRD